MYGLVMVVSGEGCPTKAMESRHAPNQTTSRLSTQLSNIRRFHRNNDTNFRQSAVHQLVAQYIFLTPNMNHVFNSSTGQCEAMAALLMGEMAQTWNT